MEVLIIGAGIGGLPFCLMLHRAAILQEVYRRTGDKPFRSIDDVISGEELVVLSERYKRVAGYDKERLKAVHLRHGLG